MPGHDRLDARLRPLQLAGSDLPLPAGISYRKTGEKIIERLSRVVGAEALAGGRCQIHAWYSSWYSGEAASSLSLFITL